MTLKTNLQCAETMMAILHLLNASRCGLFASLSGRRWSSWYQIRIVHCCVPFALASHEQNVAQNSVFLEISVMASTCCS